MEFVERTKAPAKNNKNYYSKENPFYPSYVDNCTWYCWGRQLELGVDPLLLKQKLPTSNAENWYHDTTFEKCKFPRVGDIGCYKGGVYHKSSDGPGHVFTVEEVFDNGDIRISESGTNMKFKTRVIKPPYKYYLATNYKYTFEGFIHIQDYDLKWEVGNYKALKSKYLRTSPEVANNKYKWKKLTNNGKSNCTKDALGYAKTIIGNIYKFLEFKYDKKGNIWGKTTNGKNGFLWICVRDDTGDQMKKV